MQFHEISVEFENIYIYMNTIIILWSSPAHHFSHLFRWALPATTRPPSPGVVAPPAAVPSPVLSRQRRLKTRMQGLEWTPEPRPCHPRTFPDQGVVWTMNQPTNEWRLIEDAFYEWRLVKSITVEREKYNISKNIIKNRSQKVPKPSKPFTGKMPKQKYCSQDTPPFPSPLRVAGAACRSDFFHGPTTNAALWLESHNWTMGNN